MHLPRQEQLAETARNLPYCLEPEPAGTRVVYPELFQRILVISCANASWQFALDPR